MDSLMMSPVWIKYKMPIMAAVAAFVIVVLWVLLKPNATNVSSGGIFGQSAWALMLVFILVFLGAWWLLKRCRGGFGRIL